MSHLEQQLADLELPFGGSFVERRELPQVCRVDARAVLDELLRHFVVAVRTSVVERHETSADDNRTLELVNETAA